MVVSDDDDNDEYDDSYLVVVMVVVNSVERDRRFDVDVGTGCVTVCGGTFLFDIEERFRVSCPQTSVIFYRRDLGYNTLYL